MYENVGLCVAVIILVVIVVKQHRYIKRLEQTLFNKIKKLDK